MGRGRMTRSTSILDKGGNLLDLYDLAGSHEDPVRMARNPRNFVIDELGRPRSYLMPIKCETIREMKDYVRDNLPLEDSPDIFGLHETATIKANTDLATDIMHRTYIYQFVIKKSIKIILLPK